MPKIIEYPRAPFQRVIEMADAVDYLGGKCSVQSCADKLRVKVTGAFTALIGAAKKHGLVESSKNALIITDVYKKIKLAYDDNERRQNMRLAFLAPPTYNKVYEKFKGRELPVQMLDKLLIREFGVESDVAQRISNYFIEGAKSCELLIDNKLIDINNEDSNLSNNAETSSDNGSSNIESGRQKQNVEVPKSEPFPTNASAESYVVHIYGPGMNSKITISEEEDLIILDAMISKLKKRMNEQINY
jgi:DNA-directed RNA polymerase beta' subunit